jgi:hypothetical protein
MSEKTIAERMQVKGERCLAVIGASAAVDRKIGVEKQRCDISRADVVLLFVPNRARLASSLPDVLKEVSKSSILWIAYPKLTSTRAADLSRDVVRELTGKSGLDTVSQIAIDEDWSAMRVKRIR